MLELVPQRKNIAIYVDESPNLNKEAIFIECTDIDVQKNGTICNATLSFDITYVPAETKTYRTEFDAVKMLFYTGFFVVKTDDVCYNIYDKKIQEVDRLLHILFDVRITNYIRPEVAEPMEELEQNFETHTKTLGA